MVFNLAIQLHQTQSHARQPLMCHCGKHQQHKYPVRVPETRVDGDGGGGVGDKRTTRVYVHF